MKAAARALFIRESAPKLRAVLDLVRGLPVARAREILQFSGRGATGPVSKVLESAVANASHNHALDAAELRVLEAYADLGPVLKRVRPKARGRAGGIRKPTAHVTIVVGDGRDEESA
ncbi:MAG TPA: 50S ribosomal protein L22 [Acidimicrobiia bacterium]|uniref:Large ribosomal subunit protein uL22 n=1 Tax=uncultured actinobacterium Rifle_16ft_4_minimus_2010 TaxID=1665146 RepID=A0A0H4T4G3_9ACTN|nr:50S ribosomal protein L22 [uncultured actinobacterium Rifle_16ft_4_minimus_2010]HLE38520.1 50S ribosomal protein L22 [Acidimicrobiia bacterium]